MGRRAWASSGCGGGDVSFAVAGAVRTGRPAQSRDDPGAPAANSLVPSVNVVVTNSSGEVLLIRRSDNQNWAVPGGAIDLGESMVQAAVRETKWVTPEVRPGSSGCLR